MMNSFENLSLDGSHLPSEILTEIFSNLKVHDRKNVRLTCSQWYRACNALSLVQSEKMVILSDENYVQPWFDVLMDCPRPRFHLEFLVMKYPPDATVFWQKLGSRVESLKLVGAIQQKEFCRQMIKYCNNLKKLHIRDLDGVAQNDDCILHWEEPEIHESLECLVLEDCPFLTDFHFSRLFDIYPGIQKLALINSRVNCHKRVDARFYKDTSKCTSDSIFSMSSVYANIKSKAENIKSLVLDRIGSSGLIDDWFEELSVLPGLKLKELELNRHSQLSEIAFLKFFASQTSLECIKIYKCHHFSLKCFLILLQNCSNLKVVKVECFELNVNFLMGKEILHALILLPHLKILKLKGLFFMEENVNANRAAPVSATAFQCLQELTLKMPVMYFDIFSPKIHSNLSVLHVVNENGYEGLKDVNLQLIFKKWIHLRSLSLSLDSSVSDFGFCGIRSTENQTENSGISINRLKKLEKLVLIFKKDASSSITFASFSHFVFPNLQKLRLVQFPRVTEESYKFLCQNTPSMKHCEFRMCEFDYGLVKSQEGWKSLEWSQVGSKSYVWRKLDCGSRTN